MIIKFIQDYLTSNSITDFSGFSLQDDGQGVFIKNWSYQIPQPSLPSMSDILCDKLKGEVKQEASKRIIATYPEWKQRNRMAAVVDIQNKELIALKANTTYTLSADELDIVAAAQAAKTEIFNIRAKSDELEASLDTMTQEQLEAFDATNDSN
jgi:hypothetical protein